MKTLRVDRFGTPPILTNIPKPLTSSGQVGIDIKACALNFSDLLMCKGTYQDTPSLPFSLGMEAAGVVSTPCAEAPDLPENTRVAVFSGHGGLSEYGCFSPERCVKIPDPISFAEAAAMQVTYGTSHLALHHKARIKPNETLLILGAAGGVGLSAIEIGKLLGAQVIAVARGEQKLEICRAFGADHVIDSDKQNIRDCVKALGGADVVYDSVGGEQGELAFRATNPNGRFLHIGFASGIPPKIAANHLLVKNITTIGLNWSGYWHIDPATVRASIAELFEWQAQGKISPHICATYPLEQANDALEMLKQRRSTGKIVVTMGQT